MSVGELDGVAAVSERGIVDLPNPFPLRRVN